MVLLKLLFYSKHLWSGPDKERTAPSLYIPKVQGHVCLLISSRKVNFLKNKGVVIFPQKDFFLKIGKYSRLGLVTRGVKFLVE